MALRLSTEAEALDELTVTLDVDSSEVAEQAAALSNKQEQATT